MVSMGLGIRVNVALWGGLGIRVNVAVWGGAGD